jgi:hypothetical protein
MVMEPDMHRIVPAASQIDSRCGTRSADLGRLAFDLGFLQDQEFPDLIELTKPGGKFDLRPPTPYEIGNMIRLPAEAAGLRFEQDRDNGQRLDDALRDVASVTPESLPLLEHVLSLLMTSRPCGAMTCSGGRIITN